MGLLEKAAELKLKVREGISHPFRKRGQGLLSRARSFREGGGIEAAPSEGNGLEMGHGLLQKASYFRDLAERGVELPLPGEKSSRNEPPMGLFRRALRYREELEQWKGETGTPGFPTAESPAARSDFGSGEKSASESGINFDEEFGAGSDLDFGEEPVPESGIDFNEESAAGSDLDFGEEPASESGINFDEEFGAVSDLDFGEEPASESGINFDEEPPAEESFDSGEEISESASIDEDFDRSLEELLGEETGEEATGEAPEGLEYEGNSPPEEDPAMDGHLTRNGEQSSMEEAGLSEYEKDPFDLWEEEAEDAAESTALSTLKNEREGKEGEFLLPDEDLDFSTRPMEERLAGQKKIDNYLALFDITRELSNIDDFDELWEALLYAVMGQLGTEKMCIFSSTRAGEKGASFYPVIQKGVVPEEGWVFHAGDEIYDSLEKRPGVRYAKEFLGGSLSPVERHILETLQAGVLIPLTGNNRFYGIMILSDPINGGDYSLDDLEFLGLLGELSSSGVDRILSRIRNEEETRELRRKDKIYEGILNFVSATTSRKDLDGIYDLLGAHLKESFGVESYSLILLSPGEQEYRIFAGNEISPETIEKFHLPVTSDLVGMVSNITRVYELKDFTENRELLSNYLYEDLALMEHYTILPLINLNWLVGFLTIHRTSSPWTSFHRNMAVSLAEMAAPVLANAVIIQERESIFRDPFSPLEERLRFELSRAAEFHTPVSVVDLRLKNLKRLYSLNPGEDVAAFLMEVGRILSRFLYNTDFMARIGQGRYAIILPGRSREEAEVFVRKLQGEIRRPGLLRGSPVEVQFSKGLLTYPYDTEDPDRMLSIFD